jgi:Transposase DDE domain
MINNFDDFCLYVYVIVDDIWQDIAPLFKRPGPAPDCSDSELLAMALIGECRGWDIETELLSYWGEHRDLFPNIPSQSRFNRRRRNLMEAFRMMQGIILQMLDLAQDRQVLIDSLPLPVVQFHHAPQASRDWLVHEADFGKVSSKKLTIFGYKLHLLVTLNGIIIDFHLAPASCHDLKVAEDILSNHHHLEVFGDKAYISAQIAEELRQERHILLRTLSRANQKPDLPKSIRRLHNRVRQMIETVNGQLTEQFNLEQNHAHSFWGLCTRLLTKLTAHTLSIYINRLLGKPEYLQIKSLAFPNYLSFVQTSER